MRRFSAAALRIADAVRAAETAHRSKNDDGME
jgi:hypothetical protein